MVEVEGRRVLVGCVVVEVSSLGRSETFLFSDTDPRDLYEVPSPVNLY